MANDETIPLLLGAVLAFGIIGYVIGLNIGENRAISEARQIINSADLPPYCLKAIEEAAQYEADSKNDIYDGYDSR